MSATETERGNRQRLRGVVVRDKASRTITVEVMRRLQHPRYGKMVRRHSRLAAHDPADEAKIGDTVEIISCRPLSKTKRYRLLRIVERGPGEALVGQPPARPEPEKPEESEPAETPETPAETAETEPEAETPAETAGAGSAASSAGGAVSASGSVSAVSAGVSASGSVSAVSAGVSGVSAGSDSSGFSGSGRAG
ncbi:MAG: 30S ribosomal protein S17, partial [Phycisphaerae bacterium]